MELARREEMLFRFRRVARRARSTPTGPRRTARSKAQPKSRWLVNRTTSAPPGSQPLDDGVQVVGLQVGGATQESCTASVRSDPTEVGIPRARRAAVNLATVALDISETTRRRPSRVLRGAVGAAIVLALNAGAVPSGVGVIDHLRDDLGGPVGRPVHAPCCASPSLGTTAAAWSDQPVSFTPPPLLAVLALELLARSMWTAALPRLSVVALPRRGGSDGAAALRKERFPDRLPTDQPSTAPLINGRSVSGSSGAGRGRAR